MKPSLEAMEILATSDVPTFKSLMEHIGLNIVGRVNTDPLDTEAKPEMVEAIASELTESANEFVESDDLSEYKTLAEDYGFVVAIA